MSQTTRKTSPKSNESGESALAAFVSRKVEIDTMLSRLHALSDEHFELRPDEIT